MSVELICERRRGGCAKRARGDLTESIVEGERQSRRPTPPQSGRQTHSVRCSKAVGARRILEIGTLGGYSAIWLARALPDGGQVITLEISPERAAFARSFIARSEVAGRIEVREGRALDLLPRLAAEPPFDLVFIDADKESYPAYLEWSLKLVRPGGVIAA